MWKLTKVISGGQTGADLAGVKAAKESGWLKTGGWMPKGFKNQGGLHPEFAGLYSMEETKESTYPDRTRLNVANSDGTIRFCENFDTPGEKLTKYLIRSWGKHSLDIGMREFMGTEEIATVPSLIINWLNKHSIETLNIAGNSERTAPGIGEDVYEILTETFFQLKFLRYKS